MGRAGRCPVAGRVGRILDRSGRNDRGGRNQTIPNYSQFTNLVLPALPVHILGDLTFFLLIWPNDLAPPLVWQNGLDVWFGIYSGLAIFFTALARLAFKQLARVTAPHTVGSESGPKRRMPVNDLAIWTENLTRSFAKVQAVDRLSLEVPAGVIFGFLGPNGAGKTTTIRLLMGLLEATSGRAKVFDFDTQKQAGEIRQRTGALLEHSGLYEHLSAEDNLEFYGRIWHLSAADRTTRIKELLDHFGLWERRKERVGTWSRGMRQKLSIARALLHRPSLIFLDEPTAGLDPVMAAAVRDDLAALVKHESVTVFLTTHNLTEAEKLCGLIAVIRQGKLLAIGNPDELRGQGGALRVEIVGRGFRNELLGVLHSRPEIAAVDLQNNHLILELREGTDVAPLTSLLVTAGVEIEEIHKVKASLEEVFLTLMKEEV